MTTIYIHAPKQPALLKVTAGEKELAIYQVEQVGSFWLGGATTRLWKVEVSLEPSALHIVTMADPDFSDKTVEVTRFTTAGSYDKAQGTAANLKQLQFWTVKYPVNEIASGNCVFAEYHGYVKLDYEPAEVPDTPAKDVIYRVTIRPKNGLQNTSVFTFTGESLFEGYEPTGDYRPPPSFPALDLDPSREYCVSMAAWGYGDKARLPLGSAPICAPVTLLYASGTQPSSDAGSSPASDGAVSPPSDGGTADSAIEPRRDSGGCSLASHPSGSLLLLIMALGLCRKRNVARAK